MSEILDLNTNDDNRPSIFSRRKFNYVEVLQLAKDLADAVNYIHNELSPDAMIIHRDIKPDNLGLTSAGRLKLFDFGLCRCVKKHPTGSNLSTAYEMTGHTGSLRYMAPEVVLERPYNEKVDVYSFGIVVWSIAMNKMPFRGFDRAKHHAAVVIAGGRPKVESGWPSAFSHPPLTHPLTYTLLSHTPSPIIHPLTRPRTYILIITLSPTLLPPQVGLPPFVKCYHNVGIKTVNNDHPSKRFPHDLSRC